MSRNPSVLCRNTGIWQLVSLTLVLNVHFWAGEKGLGQPVHNQAAPQAVHLGLQKQTNKTNRNPTPAPPSQRKPPNPPKAAPGRLGGSRGGAVLAGQWQSPLLPVPAAVPCSCSAPQGLFCPGCMPSTSSQVRRCCWGVC